MIRYVLVLLLIPTPVWSWGFFAHKQINRYAITTLPPGMFAFYKKNLVFLTEKSVNPDKRRYRVLGEAAKHFIDMEAYLSTDPAVLAKKPTHGIVPWAIVKVQKQLTQAFVAKNSARILKLSADLGHYVADAHVPLHTTQNYNGQLTGQEGIHALWETRLPLLFFESYNFFVGPACYIEHPFAHGWSIVTHTYSLVEKVLRVEKEISAQYPALLKYSFEQNGCVLQKQYSRAFSTSYHEKLQGQVEACFQKSILAVGSFWLTAWVNAGSPNLDELDGSIPIQKEENLSQNQTKELDDIRDCPD
ncbi:MAG: S1/P1 Nuclease [Amoebophilaceae bacterium]|nr:S1/P1 Nuclease [Amoebophilaceae bacterium]